MSDGDSGKDSRGPRPRDSGFNETRNRTADNSEIERLMNEALEDTVHQPELYEDIEDVAGAAALLGGGQEQLPPPAFQTQGNPAAASAADQLGGQGQPQPGGQGQPQPGDQVPRVPTPPATPQPVRMATVRLTLPVYSGHESGTSYVLDGKTVKEEFTTLEWLERVADIAKASGADMDGAALQAALHLVPQSPAAIWLRVRKDAGDQNIETWTGFSTEITKEFQSGATTADFVKAMRSMKMQKGERTGDFANRCRLIHNKMAEGLRLPTAYLVTDNKGTKEEATKKVLGAVSDFYLQAIFSAGLREDILEEVTAAGADTMDEMLAVAKRVEAARGTNTKKAKIAAMGASRRTTDSSDEDSSSDDEQSVKARLKKLEAIAAKEKKGDKKGDNKKKKKGDKKDKDKTQGKPCCWYCTERGHIMPDCELMEDDREKGVYRACVKTEAMSEAEFKKLSRKEKYIGKEYCPGGKYYDEKDKKAQAGIRAPRDREEDRFKEYFTGN